MSRSVRGLTAKPRWAKRVWKEAVKKLKYLKKPSRPRFVMSEMSR